MQATSALIWSNETKTRFAALVCEVLKRERISQETLAKQIGVTQGTISLWTKGAIKTTPSQKIALPFGAYEIITQTVESFWLKVGDRVAMRDLTGVVKYIDFHKPSNGAIKKMLRTSVLQPGDES